jgi:hypothetical protein
MQTRWNYDRTGARIRQAQPLLPGHFALTRCGIIVGELAGVVDQSGLVLLTAANGEQGGAPGAGGGNSGRRGHGRSGVISGSPAT